MTNKFKVGDEFVDYAGDVCLTILMVDGVWKNEQEQADYIEEMGEDYYEGAEIICYESEQWCEYRDDPEDCISEFNYILKSEFAALQEERNKIVETLKSLGIDTNNLIVSDGRAYVGADECAGYIQATHAWCSSSMAC